MLPSFPHMNDPYATAGGDTDIGLKPRGTPAPFGPGSPMGQSPAAPPMNNRNFVAAGRGGGGGFRQKKWGNGGTDANLDDQRADLVREAEAAGTPDDDVRYEGFDFLQAIREAEAQANTYRTSTTVTAWTRSLKAIHNEHHEGSVYSQRDYRYRSRLFRPKTRSALRKDQASVASSMFNTLDAITCVPGNESDMRQKAAAAVMQELVNYRTDRSSTKASIPWFPTCLGARHDAVVSGICLSKQSWLFKTRKAGTQTIEEADEAGNITTREEPVHEVDVDRPDIKLCPFENFVIDPSADWTNPAQSASYLILKWPMQIEDVLDNMEAPNNPWNHHSVDELIALAQNVTFDADQIRRAREFGLDRYSQAQAGKTFKIIWVYETFMKVGGEDWTFYSLGHQSYLTEPATVREVYPEQGGERPLAMGYGSLEPHRIFPMSPVESWQAMQSEINDLANLYLDAIKQNVMPVSKIRRGRQVDLDQVRRRSSGSSIMVMQPDDVTWDPPAPVPNSIPMAMRDIELEMDDLAGQFNGQSAEHNNALSRTLGGLKLVAGSANAVQEMDIRIWIETWVTPCLQQLVKLEQWYEHDPIVLGLCGERAQLFQKHGIDAITDELLTQEVTVRVSVGLGAGDPQQRLAKFMMATQAVMPVLQASKKFQSGEMEVDEEAVIQEVYGAAGYRDGGKRFFKQGAPQQNPMMGLEAEKIKSQIQKDDRTGRAQLLSSLADVAKVALGRKEFEDAQVQALLDKEIQAKELGHQHGKQQNSDYLAAMDHGHRHGLALAGHQREGAHQDRTFEREGEHADRNFEAEQEARQQERAAQGAKKPAAKPKPKAQERPQAQQRPVRWDYDRHPETGQVTGARAVYDEREPVRSPFAR